MAAEKHAWTSSLCVASVAQNTAGVVRLWAAASPPRPATVAAPGRSARTKDRPRAARWLTKAWPTTPRAPNTMADMAGYKDTCADDVGGEAERTYFLLGQLHCTSRNKSNVIENNSTGISLPTHSELLGSGGSKVRTGKVLCLHNLSVGSAWSCQVMREDKGFFFVFYFGIRSRRTRSRLAGERIPLLIFLPNRGFVELSVACRYSYFPAMKA